MSDDKLDDGGPAYPRTLSTGPVEVRRGWMISYAQTGMSLRDHFAGQALNGELSRCEDPNDITLSCEGLAKWSYEMADAMLAERAKGNDRG